MELLSCGDQRLSPLPTRYPCLVAHTLEAEEDDPLAQHHCRRYEGCFHGWVVLSSFPRRRKWSIWNPSTSKIISLPDLILENPNYYKYLGQSCLTSAPDHPGSLLLLTRSDEPTILLCRLDGKGDGKIKSLRWTNICYAKQSITDSCVLSSLTSCNGKVYALNSGNRNHLVINLKLTVKDRVVIKLLPYGGGKLPDSLSHAGYCSSSSLTPHLIGSSSELFCILLGSDKVAKKSSLSVYLFKLETTSMIWEEVEDLKDAIFFLDSSYDHSVFYKPGIASEFGGYIHILSEMGKVMYSYHIKDKTVSISSMPSIPSTSRVSLWECSRIQEEGNKDETVVGNACTNDTSSISTRNERPEESYLLSIPSEILERIMDFCVGFDYLNFRTACKSCQLAAPMIPFINRMRLGTTSFDTPWLLVLDKNREIITFTDPMFGENYFIKTPPGLVGDMKIHCSRYGWLLMEKYGGSFVFYNPFTSVIHELPQVPYSEIFFERSYSELETFCFSAPPTSPDCMVVGYRKVQTYWQGYVHYVGRQPARWIEISVNYGLFDQESLRYSIFHGRCLFVLLNDGRLHYFRLAEGRSLYSAIFLPRPPISCESLPQKYLVERDQHLLLVIVGEFGESVEVFKLNSTKKWEKIDSLGRHMIYICGRTCLCIEAKTPEMENKIYFPRLRSGNGRIVFYSLETQRYHTFNDRDIEENFGDIFGTKHHLNPHAWIEPCWR